MSLAAERVAAFHSLRERLRCRLFMFSAPDGSGRIVERPLDGRDVTVATWSHAGEAADRIRGEMRWRNTHTSRAMKQAAQSAVSTAVRAGELERPGPCESCGSFAGSNVYHHHDYAKPLDVIPLCRACHMLIHNGRLIEPRTGRMYPLFGGACR